MFKLLVSAVEGDQVDRLPDVLRIASFRADKIPTKFDSWTDLARYICDTQEKRVGVAFNKGWTILLNEDVSIAIYGNPGVGQRIARRRNARVCVIYGNSTTATFSLALFPIAGVVQRLWIENGRMEEEGNPLLVEPVIAPEEFNEEHLMEIAKGLGIEVESPLEECPPYFAYAQRKRWKPW